MTDAAAVATLRGAVVRYPAGPSPVGPLDLSVAPGEIVALVGASGAGKSTALRLIAGLEAASEGAAVRTTDRIGFVFQNPTLAPWLSALDNVALPLRLSGVPADQSRARAATALTSVGLGDRLAARPRELSGGMAMRVSLARALVVDPALLLLDEPFAALDSITRRRLIEDLHALWTGRTPRPAIVFVTHDVEEAVYLAARTVVLDARGRAVADLPAPGPLPRPAGWRAEPPFRRAVETVADALAGTMP